MNTERLEMLIDDYRLYGEELAHHILDELVGLLLAKLDEIKRDVAEAKDLPTLRSLLGVLDGCLPEGVDGVEFVRRIRDRLDSGD